MRRNKKKRSPKPPTPFPYEVAHWTVRALSPGLHYRINNVLDIWPATKKWLPVYNPEYRKARIYDDRDHLIRIVGEEEAAASERGALRGEIQMNRDYARVLADPKDKDPITPVSSWAEFGRLFDGPIQFSQQKLFDPGPTQKKQVRPSRDPMAAHNARVPEEWGPDFIPDPDGEKPPWN